MNLIVFIVLCTSAALARKGFGPTDQEWGFVTVRKGAHMFWWLHKTIANVENYTDRPLVIWLQGGPGGSSTGFGNFAELGPVDENLNPRNFTWVRDYNVLFVDNPVGTGYSHVDSGSYLTTTNREIAEDFVVLLKGFYDAVPELKDAPLYIFSESYGGKMTAEIALAVDRSIKEGDLEIELIGVGLGDAWISPIDYVMTWSSYLLHVGAVDQNGFKRIQEAAEETKRAFNNGDFTIATNLWRQTEIIIWQVTENIDFYNILTHVQRKWKARDGMAKPAPQLRDAVDDQIKYLMNGEVRSALDLNVTWGDQRSAVFDALSEDFMKPVTNIVELLLNTTDIKVAVYNGQLDLIVDTPGTVKWVDELKFEGGETWTSEAREPLLVNSVVEGYYRKLGNFAMYWVNRAGHMVPADNPAAMDYILKDMTENYQKTRRNNVF